MACDTSYISVIPPLQSTTANSAVPVSLSGKKGAAASSIVISSSKVHNDCNCDSTFHVRTDIVWTTHNHSSSVYPCDCFIRVVCSLYVAATYVCRKGY